MTETIEDEIRAVLASMEQNEGEQENQERQTFQEPETNTQPPPHEIQDIYVLIVREHEEVEEDQPLVVDSEPAKPQQPLKQPFDYVTFCIVLICSIPMLASIILQVYLLQNPPIATITIIPKSQTISLTGTLQMGRLLQPIEISQSATTPTTGHGHQDARNATGYITFYNGELNTVSIAAGTILTSSQGVQIATEQDANIPAADPTATPPAFGQVSVSAHAISPGARGNIPAYDINQACCYASVIAKNTAAFKHGQDERDFSTVSQQDINKISTPLKISLAQSTQGALQGQLNPNEQLQLLPCIPTVTSNHQVAQEATQVKVTVSETCSAVAYNSQALREKATALLSTQAVTKLGTGYSLFGDINVTVKQASVTSAPHPLVLLSFEAHGTWIYALSQSAQQQIKHIIAGKTTQQALNLLASLPGVKQAAIRFNGFGDETRLPTVTSNIHFQIIIQNSY